MSLNLRIREFALSAIHRDPFDRMLVAQARAEGFVLLTSDAEVAEYGAPARLVQRVRR